MTAINCHPDRLQTRTGTRWSLTSYIKVNFKRIRKNFKPFNKGPTVSKSAFHIVIIEPKKVTVRYPFINLIYLIKYDMTSY
jgi:hypothetical protein